MTRGCIGSPQLLSGMRYKVSAMKKALFSIVFCLIVVIGGGALLVGALRAKGYRIGFQLEPAGQNIAGQEEQVSERLPNVKVRILEGRTVKDQLGVTGRIEPWEAAIVSAETGGVVEWEGVDEGDTVTAGSELARIDTESLRTQLKQAKAQHELAIQELKRIRELEKEGINSPQALDHAIAERDIAQARVRTTEIELEKSVVHASFDAVVDKIFVEKGEYVGRGNPLTRLVQLNRVKAVVSIPERDLPHFEEGDTVTITIDAFPNDAFQGAIFHIATTADPLTRSFPAEISLDNKDARLRPGMVARAQFVRRTFENAVAVPIFSVISLEGRYVVYTEEDGIARMRQVEVGVFEDSMVHIVSGLTPGDRLIVKGQREISAGDRVRVTEEVPG